MSILIIVTDRPDSKKIETIAVQQASDLNMHGLSFKSVSFEQVQLEGPPSAIILDLFYSEHFKSSIEIITRLLIPSKTPFIYISSVEIAPEKVSKYFPDQLVTSSYTEEILKVSIRLFLQKIKAGYFTYPTNKRINDRLWLSLKRGVYISLEANEIKYVEAEDHYIKIHSDKQSLPLIKSSLKDFYQSHLKRFGHFCILSRSCIINAHKIWKIENGQLFIDPNKPLSIPRNKREEILSFVGIGGGDG